MSENKKRVNVTVSEELFNWVEGVANDMGLSVPALFVVAMAQYKEQKTAMVELPKLLDRLKELDNSQK